MTCRIAVLISGNGSNLQALIDACAAGDTDGRIVCVLSNRPDAYGLIRAEAVGIPAVSVLPGDYADRQAYDLALIAQLETFQPEIVVLAGYMRILSPAFIRHFQGRILNIHPSLLPKYPGLNTHQRALEAGDTVHGCSVHFVTDTLDGGPVILQAELPVTDNDTPETLAARVLKQEHRILPRVTQWLASGRLQMRNGKALMDGQHLVQRGVTGDHDDDEQAEQADVSN